jgi:hypothetical protein
MELRLNCGRSKYRHFHRNEVTRKESTFRNKPQQEQEPGYQTKSFAGYAQKASRLKNQPEAFQTILKTNKKAPI